MLSFNRTRVSGYRFEVVITLQHLKRTARDILCMGCSDVSEFEHIYGQMTTIDAILCVRAIVYMNKNDGFSALIM